MTSETLYKFYEGQVVPLQSDKCLFRCELDGVWRIVDNDLVLVARLCGVFASLGEHTRRLASVFCDSDRPMSFWSNLLTRAAEMRVLLCRDDLVRVAHCVMSASPRRRAIEVIAIPTRNRPRLLARLLTGLTTHLREFSREVDVIIMDDSESEDVQLENKRILWSFASGSNMRLRYGNRHSRHRVVRIVAEQYRADASTIEFGLLGYPEHQRSVGAARNAILADCRDKCVLYLDDDVQCIVAKLPGATDEVVLGGGPDLFSEWALSSADEMQIAPLVHQDLLKLHEQALNLSPSPDEGGGPSEVNVSHLTPSLLRHIHGRNCRVVVSQIGIIGDCARDSLLPYFVTRPENLQSMSESSERYDQALRSRISLRGPRAWIATDRLNIMSYCMSVDNTGGHMPPFSPVLRAQELVFAELVRTCVPGALFGAIPRAILHDPDEVRTIGRRTVPADSGLDGDSRRSHPVESVRLPANMVLQNLIDNFGGPVGMQARDALISMGRRLQDLSGLATEDFNRAIEATNASALTTCIRRLENVAQAGGPERWLSDVCAARDACLRSLNTFAMSTPPDIEREAGTARSPATFQNFVSDFGKLLQTWPHLVECMSDLRERDGISCASELET